MSIISRTTEVRTENSARFTKRPFVVTANMKLCCGCQHNCKPLIVTDFGCKSFAFCSMLCYKYFKSTTEGSILNENQDPSNCKRRSYNEIALLYNASSAQVVAL